MTDHIYRPNYVLFGVAVFAALAALIVGSIGVAHARVAKRDAKVAKDRVDELSALVASLTADPAGTSTTSTAADPPGTITAARWLDPSKLNDFVTGVDTQDMIYATFRKQIIRLHEADDEHITISSTLQDDGLTWLPTYGNELDNWGFQPSLIAENPTNGTLMAFDWNIQSNQTFKLAIQKVGDVMWTTQDTDAAMILPGGSNQVVTEGVFCTDAGTWFVVGRANNDSIAIYRSTDDGESWELLNLGDAAFIEDDGIDESSAYTRGDTIIVCTKFYGNVMRILRSTDGGDSWSKTDIISSSEPRGIHFIEPLNATVISCYVGSNNSYSYKFSMLVSYNDGVSWELIGADADMGDPKLLTRLTSWRGVLHVPTADVIVALTGNSLVVSKDLETWHTIDGPLAHVVSTGIQFSGRAPLFHEPSGRLVLRSGNRTYVTTSNIQASDFSYMDEGAMVAARGFHRGVSVPRRRPEDTMALAARKEALAARKEALQNAGDNVVKVRPVRND